MNDQQRREVIAALSERVQKRIQLAERCRNATSAAFRGHLAEIAGLTRHLVQTVGLAADVQRDFDGAARGVLQGMAATATDAPKPALNSGKLRWCVVVEELQGAKARCARVNRSSGSGAGEPARPAVCGTARRRRGARLGDVAGPRQ
jgi:hypothetical protein